MGGIGSALQYDGVYHHGYVPGIISLWSRQQESVHVLPPPPPTSQLFLLIFFARPIWFLAVAFLFFLLSLSSCSGVRMYHGYVPGVISLQVIREMVYTARLVPSPCVLVLLRCTYYSFVFFHRDAFLWPVL